MGQIPKKNAAWSKPISEETLFRESFDQSYIKEIADKLSEIGMYELGFRPSGTEAGHRAAELVRKEMEKLGLAMVRQEPFPVYAWGFGGARLEVHGARGRTIAASSYPPSPGTHPAGLKANLVDVGLGKRNDYLNRSVKGKIAFARLDLNVMRNEGILAREAELHGAKGVVFYYVNGFAQHESGEALNIHNGKFRPGILVIQVSINDGKYLEEQLSEKGEIGITLFSRVDANPEGVGYNIVGVIPGKRYSDRYMVVEAHYDAWFKGYLDNATGVGGMLAIAKGMLQSGYQPDHTLIFVSTDAEEFGVADSVFDYLVGTHYLLETHQDWIGQTTCCFNFDCLCLKSDEKLRFYGSTEVIGFVREATEECHLGKMGIWGNGPTVENYVTPWNESYSWTYFGVPVIHLGIDHGSFKQTSYHTQFDTAELVDFRRSNEAVSLVGSLLIRMDKMPVAPYDLSARARAIYSSIDWPVAKGMGVGEKLEKTIEKFEKRSAGLRSAIERLDEERWLHQDDQDRRIDNLNQRHRYILKRLLTQCCYLGGDLCREVMYRHESSQKNLKILDRALVALKDGKACEALNILADKESGLAGAYFGQHISYENYYYYTVGCSKPGRKYLFWGRDRTVNYIDCWIILQALKDKIEQGVTDLGPEYFTVNEYRTNTIAALADDYAHTIELLDSIEEMLPVDDCQALLESWEKQQGT
jgi:Iap family predicted aminopeptidase